MAIRRAQAASSVRAAISTAGVVITMTTARQVLACPETARDRLQVQKMGAVDQSLVAPRATTQYTALVVASTAIAVKGTITVQLVIGKFILPYAHNLC